MFTPRAKFGSGDGAGNQNVSKSETPQEVEARLWRDIRHRILDIYLKRQNADGWNRRQFADAVGVSKVRLHRIMVGERNASLWEIERIATVGGASRCWLMWGEGDTPEGVHVIDPAKLKA